MLNVSLNSPLSAAHPAKILRFSALFPARSTIVMTPGVGATSGTDHFLPRFGQADQVSQPQSTDTVIKGAARSVESEGEPADAEDGASPLASGSAGVATSEAIQRAETPDAEAAKQQAELAEFHEATLQNLKYFLRNLASELTSSNPEEADVAAQDAHARKIQQEIKSYLGKQLDVLKRLQKNRRGKLLAGQKEEELSGEEARVYQYNERLFKGELEILRELNRQGPALFAEVQQEVLTAARTGKADGAGQAEAGREEALETQAQLDQVREEADAEVAALIEAFHAGMDETIQELLDDEQYLNALTGGPKLDEEAAEAKGTQINQTIKNYMKAFLDDFNRNYSAQALELLGPNADPRKLDAMVNRPGGLDGFPASARMLIRRLIWISNAMQEFISAYDPVAVFGKAQGARIAEIEHEKWRPVDEVLAGLHTSNPHIGNLLEQARGELKKQARSVGQEQVAQGQAQVAVGEPAAGLGEEQAQEAENEPLWAADSRIQAIDQLLANAADLMGTRAREFRPFLIGLIRAAGLSSSPELKIHAAEAIFKLDDADRKRLLLEWLGGEDLNNKLAVLSLFTFGQRQFSQGNFSIGAEAFDMLFEDQEFRAAIEALRSNSNAALQALLGNLDGHLAARGLKVARAKETRPTGTRRFMLPKD